MPSYALRDIPDDLWARVKARARRDELPVRAVLMAYLRLYAQDVHAAGGRKAAAAMSALQRRQRAQKAASARWAK